MNILHSTEWYYSTIINTLQCTDGISLQYWISYNAPMASLRNTDDDAFLNKFETLTWRISNLSITFSEIPI